MTRFYANGVLINATAIEGKEDCARISYADLSKIVGSLIRNNTIRYCGESFELYAGKAFDEDGECIEILQDYLIDKDAAEWLRSHTEEIVYYSPALDVFLWGITHWGTSWDYVHTTVHDVRLLNN